MAMARSFPGIVAICYVLPVLWMMSYVHIMGVLHVSLYKRLQKSIIGDTIRHQFYSNFCSNGQICYLPLPC